MANVTGVCLLWSLLIGLQLADSCNRVVEGLHYTRSHTYLNDRTFHPTYLH